MIASSLLRVVCEHYTRAGRTYSFMASCSSSISHNLPARNLAPYHSASTVFLIDSRLVVVRKRHLRRDTHLLSSLISFRNITRRRLARRMILTHSVTRPSQAYRELLNNGATLPPLLPPTMVQLNDSVSRNLIRSLLAGGLTLIFTAFFVPPHRRILW